MIWRKSPLNEQLAFTTVIILFLSFTDKILNILLTNLREGLL
jgi:hypothetical protein